MSTYEAGIGGPGKQPVEGACAMHEASRKRWEDSRHAGMIEWAVQAVQGESPSSHAAEFMRFWNHSTGTFKAQLLAGLHDADYSTPHDP